MRDSEPQRSVEEILIERSKQANTHLESPLGKSFVAKNWSEFEKNYNPNHQFNELAEIIRACFIGNYFKSYTREEMDRVLNVVLKTFSAMEPKNIPLSGLLITQLERLPTPEKGTENYKILESWFSDPSAPDTKKRLTVLKLAVHDGSPSERWLSVLSQGLLGKTYGASRVDWIQWIGNMRNDSARNTILKSLAKDFNKLESEAKPEALVLLSQTPGVANHLVKDTAFKFLQSKNQANFEAGMRVVYNLAKDKLLSKADVEKLIYKMTNIPPELNSPYAEQKAKEILSVLH